MAISSSRAITASAYRSVLSPPVCSGSTASAWTIDRASGTLFALNRDGADGTATWSM